MTKNKLNQPNNAKFCFMHDFLFDYAIKSSSVHIKLLYIKLTICIQKTP